jgi:hypothetical protein
MFPWGVVEETGPVTELAGACGVAVVAVPPGPGLNGIVPLAWGAAAAVTDVIGVTGGAVPPDGPGREGRFRFGGLAAFGAPGAMVLSGVAGEVGAGRAGALIGPGRVGRLVFGGFEAVAAPGATGLTGRLGDGVAVVPIGPGLGRGEPPAVAPFDTVPGVIVLTGRGTDDETGPVADMPIGPGRVGRPVFEDGVVMA